MTKITKIPIKEQTYNNETEMLIAELSERMNSSKDWTDELRRTSKTQEIKSTITNGELILQNDEYLKDMLKYDLFEKVTKVKRIPDWRSSNDTNNYWLDLDTTHVKAYIDKTYNVQFSTDMLNEVIDHEAYANKYHPIKSMIESKDWDGNERLETLFIDYLGAPDTHYTRQAAVKWVMGSVARVYHPGIKFDTMPVLYGEQGSGKSTFAAKMGGQWYNSSLNSFSGDEAFKKLQGSWICEIQELSAFQKSTIEEIKGFIDAVVDVYRASYGRRVERHPRQCVFIGSTNNYEFLKDKTGNRRFWPITTNKEQANKSPHDDLTQEVVQQLYAEAKYYFDKDPTSSALLLDEEAAQDALEMQNEHAEKDYLVGQIEEFLERPIPSDYWKMTVNEKRFEMNKIAKEKDNIKLFGNGKLIQVGSQYKPNQYKWRDKVCALEIWHVMMSHDDQPQQHHLRKIDTALRNTIYCNEKKKYKRFGEGIGRQYGFDVDLEPYYKSLLD